VEDFVFGTPAAETESAETSTEAKKTKLSKEERRLLSHNQKKTKCENCDQVFPSYRRWENHDKVVHKGE